VTTKMNPKKNKIWWMRLFRRITTITLVLFILPPMIITDKTVCYVVGASLLVIAVALAMIAEVFCAGEMDKLERWLTPYRVTLEKLEKKWRRATLNVNVVADRI
jgi:uncharacterized membrane protein HdeD (DUF308 family)